MARSGTEGEPTGLRLRDFEFSLKSAVDPKTGSWTQGSTEVSTEPTEK